MCDKVYVYSDDISVFPIHNGVYIHSLSKDEFFTIEEGVGTYVWSQLDGTKDIGQIIKEVARLCRRETNEVAEDIAEFVEELLDKRLIEEKS